MSPRLAKPTRKLRGAQKWILQELRDLAPATSLSTSKISKRISKLSGKQYHKNSVYLALRELTGRGVIKAIRKGNEKSYQLAGGPRASGSSPTPKPETAALMAPAKAPETGAQMTWPERVAHDAMLPHKLALGEILVLSVSNGHVLAATNLHGRLVFERHPI